MLAHSDTKFNDGWSSENLTPPNSQVCCCGQTDIDRYRADHDETGALFVTYMKFAMDELKAYTSIPIPTT
jgi:hypothetical protein